MKLEPTDSLPEIWRKVTAELRRANADRRHPFRQPVLSTCAKETPSQRTVVLRKFEQDASCLVYTDRRSQKIAELEDSPTAAASLLFWHPKQRLQVRMGCQVELLGKAETEQHWQQVPPVARQSYTTTLAPGSLIENPSQVQYDAAAEDGRFFVVLRLRPKSVDVLQLNRGQHLRAGFTWEGDRWTGNWLLP